MQRAEVTRSGSIDPFPVEEGSLLGREPTNIGSRQDNTGESQNQCGKGLGCHQESSCKLRIESYQEGSNSPYREDSQLYQVQVSAPGVGIVLQNKDVEAALETIRKYHRNCLCLQTLQGGKEKKGGEEKGLSLCRHTLVPRKKPREKNRGCCRQSYLTSTQATQLWSSEEVWRRQPHELGAKHQNHKREIAEGRT